MIYNRTALFFRLKFYRRMKQPKRNKCFWYFMATTLVNNNWIIRICYRERSVSCLRCCYTKQNMIGCRKRMSNVPYSVYTHFIPTCTMYAAAYCEKQVFLLTERATNSNILGICGNVDFFPHYPEKFRPHYPQFFSYENPKLPLNSETSDTEFKSSFRINSFVVYHYTIPLTVTYLFPCRK